MRAGNQRLGLIITDTADSNMTFHLSHVVFKFCAEGRVLNVVNCPLKLVVIPIDRHTTAACTQM